MLPRCALCIQRRARLRYFPPPSGYAPRALSDPLSTALGRSVTLVHIEKYVVPGGQYRDSSQWERRAEDRSAPLTRYVMKIETAISLVGVVMAAVLHRKHCRNGAVGDL